MSTGTTAAQIVQSTMPSPVETVKMHPTGDPKVIQESASGIKYHVLAVVKVEIGRASRRERV